jgi:hypothetical protein
MKIFAITHGEKQDGGNPSLTFKGIQQIDNLVDKVLNLHPTSVIIGTGRRFIETYYAISGTVPNLSFDQVKACPLLGSADSGKKAESGWDVMLADGTEIRAGNYVGLVELQNAIDWFGVLDLMAQEDTLLVTGREFIGALMGSADQAKSATVYTIDTETKVVTEV